MQKILKLSTVSMLAIMTANGANAAGYTCEELVEYTSCNPGYHLKNSDVVCPSGYIWRTGICWDYAEYTEGKSKEYCQSEQGELVYAGDKCVKEECVENGCNRDDYEVTASPVSATVSCDECPAGSFCNGGIASPTKCGLGTYQPNTGQSSCLTTPAGNYSGAGATNYTACSAGSYQPSAGKSSCVTCPAGSYCATTGLTAVSGVCADGSYATGGATSCTQCLPTGLVDSNGNEVLATTGGTGAGSLAACYVSPDTHFKNDKGIYHYKSDCSAYNLTPFDISTATEAEKQARCEDLGGTWYAEINNEMDQIPEYCESDKPYQVPSSIDTEEECWNSGYNLTWFDEGCNCEVTSTYNLETGEVVCGQ